MKRLIQIWCKTDFPEEKFLFHLIDGRCLHLEEIVASGIHQTIFTVISPVSRLIVDAHILSGIIADIWRNLRLPSLDSRNACIHMEEIVGRIHEFLEGIPVDLLEIIELHHPFHEEA